ncbi:hypothetical protein Tco_0156092 [Tanacetum coccineum]
MKRGFRGVPRPLLPAMLPVVVDQSAGPADQAEDQPSSFEPLPSSSHPFVISESTPISQPTPVVEPTSHPKSLSPEPDNEPIEHTFEQPSPEHQPLSPRQETEVLQSQDPTHPHVPEARTMTVEDLLHLVPKLITKVNSLETELKKTKLTMGIAIVKLVKKERLQEEKCSPTTLEAAKILSKVASHKSKLADKGKRYKRRKESKGKDISTGFEEVNTGFEKVNTGGLGVSTGSGPVSSARGQREGKAPMIVEETQAPKRTKEQIQQKEASLAEAKILATLEEIRKLPTSSFDMQLLAKKNGSKELTEQQKQRKAQVQFEAQFYTKEDWDVIRAKLEAKAELTKECFLQKKELKQEEVDRVISSMNIKATKAQLKRYGEELQIEISKKQRIDDKDEEKVTEVKEEKPVIRTGKRKKQKARKIFQQGERSIYQIIRANKADTVYMSFGAMLKDFTREDLIELYRTMFDPPLNEDAIWSLTLHQKIISWRYYDKLEVYCLTLEACSIYMLADRKYPLSKDACQVMLKMKLLDGKMNEVCYKLLKMIEKQAGVRK